MSDTDCNCVLYDFTRNQIYTMWMLTIYEFGEQLMLTCAYTGDEHHYVFLGEL